MSLRIQVFVLSICFQFFIISAVTNTEDAAILKALQDIWEGLPVSWRGSDPCGDHWEGVECSASRVTSITLSICGVSGSMFGDITGLSELKILDLSYNKGLKASLPPTIGKLNKLTNLILVGCSFYGPIPDSIGSLHQLVYLSLNSNSFSGQIPATIGNLTKLYWLDLADNNLQGPIPISDGTTLGLDKLIHTKHFHLGQNKLTGGIPEALFSSEMVLLHVLFDNNLLSGPLPSSLGLVNSLEAVRFDGNSLSGNVPSNLNNLTSVSQLYLSNNKLSGPFPNLTGLNDLSYLDLSNNSFNPSSVPSWFSTLPSLTTLVMENTRLQGEIPSSIFSLPSLQSVVMKRNSLNGTLDIGSSPSTQLQTINILSNSIADYVDYPEENNNIKIILSRNPICDETGATTKAYCTATEEDLPYTTPSENCTPATCDSGLTASPTCQCAYPLTGVLHFRAPSLADIGNNTYYKLLEDSITTKFQIFELPVDSVSLSDPQKPPSQYLQIQLAVFPSGGDSFNWTGVSRIGFALSNQTYKPPAEFGPFYFIADPYLHFSGDRIGKSGKSINIVVIVGAAAGGLVLVILLVLAGVYAYRQKRIATKANDQNPFAHWNSNKSSSSTPQLKGARCFSFEELNKYTNNFSEATDIGSGGYGKVYRGTLPTGELIAIKRAQQGSMQGAVEFKNEIELLSRVHHKNLVALTGFCFDRGEQMLIYEYVPNGSLRDNLSGKTGIRLDWTRRLRIALGTARGLAYLHELANPPIIHRDIKSTNILLDERLTAKVADFGLSKPMGDSEKDHITTQVKGTLGYLDPEYYMTQQLTEKSDVYSFGVLMLELLTGRKPIERGKYVVREVRIAMDKKKDLYNLFEILDPTIGLGTTLKGFERFVDLALRCVEESGIDRPTMSEVVKEIELILQLAGINPNADSAATSASYSDAGKESAKNPYSNSDSFEYSGGFTSSQIDPH